MKCAKCGVELKDGAKFCDACGTASPQPVTPPSANNAPQKKAGSGGNIFALGSIVFAGLWILDTLIYLFMFKYLRSHYQSYNTPKFFSLLLIYMSYLRGLWNILCLSSGCIALSKRCWLGGVGIVLIILCYFLSGLLSAFAFDGMFW